MQGQTAAEDNGFWVVKVWCGLRVGDEGGAGRKFEPGGGRTLLVLNVRCDSLRPEWGARMPRAGMQNSALALEKDLRTVRDIRPARVKKDSKANRWDGCAGRFVG